MLGRINLCHRNFHGAIAKLNTAQIQVRLQLILLQPCLREVEARISQNTPAHGAKTVRRLSYPTSSHQRKEQRMQTRGNLAISRHRPEVGAAFQETRTLHEISPVLRDRIQK